MVHRIPTAGVDDAHSSAMLAVMGMPPEELGLLSLFMETNRGIEVFEGYGESDSEPVQFTADDDGDAEFRTRPNGMALPPLPNDTTTTRPIMFGATGALGSNGGDDAGSESQGNADYFAAERELMASFEREIAILELGLDYERARMQDSLRGMQAERRSPIPHHRSREPSSRMVDARQAERREIEHLLELVEAAMEADAQPEHVNEPPSNHIVTGQLDANGEAEPDTLAVTPQIGLGIRDDEAEQVQDQADDAGQDDGQGAAHIRIDSRGNMFLVIDPLAAAYGQTTTALESLLSDLLIDDEGLDDNTSHDRLPSRRSNRSGRSRSPSPPTRSRAADAMAASDFVQDFGEPYDVADESADDTTHYYIVEPSTIGSFFLPTADRYWYPDVSRAGFEDVDGDDALDDGDEDIDLDVLGSVYGRGIGRARPNSAWQRSRSPGTRRTGEMWDPWAWDMPGGLFGSAQRSRFGESRPHSTHETIEMDADGNIIVEHADANEELDDEEAEAAAALAHRPNREIVHEHLTMAFYTHCLRDSDQEAISSFFVDANGDPCKTFAECLENAVGCNDEFGPYEFNSGLRLLDANGDYIRRRARDAQFDHGARQHADDAYDEDEDNNGRQMDEGEFGWIDADLAEFSFVDAVRSGRAGRQSRLRNRGRGRRGFEEQDFSDADDEDSDDNEDDDSDSDSAGDDDDADDAISDGDGGNNVVDEGTTSVASSPERGRSLTRSRAATSPRSRSPSPPGKAQRRTNGRTVQHARNGNTLGR
ncbi:hypothetical protein HK105_201351 [Polyrhizophydium stewartii]|uniref:Uncharacterized protein n=1 Tax=Polyrhizophydium stewartii TaxID=2732419 RepID=A0ABR4NHY8_9FUNG